MSLDPKDMAQGGVITLLLGLVGWLFAKRASNVVKNANATDDRNSRFEDNLQKRYEHAMGRISELTAERDSLKVMLAEADKRLTIVQMIADGDPKRAVEVSQDSAFVDLSRPFRARAHKPVTPTDPFQAADPYAPKPEK